MRSAILLSSWCIADAINKNWLISDDTKNFLLGMFLMFICMDIIELILKSVNGNNRSKW
jgi:hypothetical protein